MKKLLDTIEDINKPPLLFIIDEVFKGTNNIERLQGSRALIKLLTNKNGPELFQRTTLNL